MTASLTRFLFFGLGLWLSSLLLLLVLTPAKASAPSDEYRYSDSELQDHVYEVNQVGIIGLGQSHHYDRLFIGYRILTGQPLIPSEIDRLIYDVRPSSINPWTEARKQATNRPFPLVKRMNSAGVDKPGIWEIGNGYCSTAGQINDNAYEVAAATLKNRQANYEPKWIELWIDSQDSVFGNCEDQSGTSPPPLPADAPEWLRFDHDYQMAAYYFHRNSFTEARKGFMAIAQNNRSPWQKLAKYLVVRTEFRQFNNEMQYTYESEQELLRREDSPEKAKQTHNRLLKFAQDFKRVQMDFPEKISLIDRLDYLLEPKKRLQTLEKRLQQVKRFDAQSWYDYDDMKYISSKDEIIDANRFEVDSFVSWQGAVVNYNQRGQALSAWQTSRDPIWLVPIVIHSRKLAELTPQTVQAILAVPKTSVLWHSVNWYYARLLISENRLSQADAIVNTGLELTPVNRTELRSVRNYWLQFKTLTTASQDEFWNSLLRFAPRSPRKYELITDPKAKAAYLKDIQSLDKPVTQSDYPDRIYNNLPLADLIAAVKQRGANFPDSLVIDISQTAMVRAFLMDDWDAAKTMVDPYLSAQDRIQQEMRKYDPKYIDYQAILIKAALLKFKQAKSLAENRLAAAIVVQSSSEFSPRLDVRYNYKDDYTGYGGNLADCHHDTPDQNNKFLMYDHEWKCSSYNPDYILVVLSKIAPRSFSQGQIQKSAEEAMIQARNGSLSRFVWLAEILIPAAKSQPSDPRLPKAFHKLIYQKRLWHFVNSTIHGLSGQYDPVPDYSKEAFLLAHKLWPHNEWVKRTKYWY